MPWSASSSRTAHGRRSRPRCMSSPRPPSATTTAPGPTASTHAGSRPRPRGPPTSRRPSTPWERPPRAASSPASKRCFVRTSPDGHPRCRRPRGRRARALPATPERCVPGGRSAPGVGQPRSGPWRLDTPSARPQPGHRSLPQIQQRQRGLPAAARARAFYATPVHTRQASPPSTPAMPALRREVPLAGA